jgi:Tol biopolymer transport system component
MRPDGSHAKAITRDTFGRRGRIYSLRPSWSPDGTRIVFTRVRVKGNEGRPDLYTMSPDGGDLERLTRMPEAFPVHPDWGTAP